MHNIRHLARVKLGKHSGRLPAHRSKAITKTVESATGERLELAPEGANMEAVEIIAMSLMQSQQFRQCTCSAHVDSEMPRIDCSRFRPRVNRKGVLAL